MGNEKVSKLLKNATILITGGTGSYGNALLDYLKGSDAHFVVYSRDESKQHDMLVSRKNENISYIVGDIRDKKRLISSMQGVDYVVHAAALKHVPTGENFPSEVISTNILGTQNVIEAAEYCGVKKVVILSSDKAVYPISAYGMSKALAEKIVLAHKGNTANVCLRYGNVLGSRGSVIPLFLDMISRGESITVTDYNMSRFILTLDEAVRLSLKCLSDGNNGDLFIMKPPACTIRTLVEALEMHLSRKIPQKVIGIRAGEKMHEVLLTGDEMYRAVIEKEGNITYARIAAKHTKDFFFEGKEGKGYIEPEPFSTQNAEQYNAEQVLGKLKEAQLL